MQQCFLERTPFDDHVSGLLTTPEGRELYTLERPWRSNQPFVSCIPDGTYIIEPYDSPKFGKVYIVSGGTVNRFPSPHHVRSGILFHPANKVNELEGCIAPGMDINAHGVISKSRLACELLFTDLQWKPAMLFISGIDNFG